MGVTLFISYQKDTTLAGVMFIATLLIGSAFYLFQFGSLSEFTLEALSAKASFIRQKAGEVERDFEQIKSHKVQSEEAAAEIEKLRNDMKDLNERFLVAEESANQVRTIALLGL